MRKIFLALCLLVLTISCLFLSIGCSCSGTETPTDTTVTVGGENTSVKEGKVVFYEANDLIYSYLATAESVLNECYVMQDGFKVSASLDLSKVSFGTAGEYDIRYFVEGSEVTKKLYIYGAPVIEGSNSITTTFSQASVKIFEGISAKDSFGVALDLQVLNYNGLINDDGSFNVGTYTVKIVAVDKAGQIASLNRTVTVSAERNPVLLSAYTYDVNDNEFTFSLEQADFDNFVSLSINSKTVPIEQRTLSQTDSDFTVTVDKAFFREQLLNEDLVQNLSTGDDYSMAVLTAMGRTVTEFTLTDNQPVENDLSSITDFCREIYPASANIRIQRIELLNPYQNVTPIYTFTKDGQSPVVCENGIFNLPVAGEWNLEIDLRGIKKNLTLTCYNDLGLTNGTIYGESNPFENLLPQGYSFFKYIVSLRGEAASILECNNLDDIDDFAAAINGLNTKYLYDLTAVAIKDGEAFSQTVNFSVVKGGSGVLGDDKDAKNIFVVDASYIGLDYKQKTVGGRTGVYQWFGKQEKTNGSDKSKVELSGDILTQMKKDYYLTFDIYYTQGLTILFSVGERNYYLWGATSFYDKRENDPDAKYAEGKFNFPEGAYCGDLVEFYTADGVKINRAKPDDDPLKSYNNQWITVQIKLGDDAEKGGASFHNYSEYYELSKQEVYFSNFRVSTASLLNDQTTVQPSTDGSAEFEDIWN